MRLTYGKVPDDGTIWGWESRDGVRRKYIHSYLPSTFYTAHPAK
jgi:hypothetical protein